MGKKEDTKMIFRQTGNKALAVTFSPASSGVSAVKDANNQDIYGMPGIDIGAYGTVKSTFKLLV